ncbi:MAG: hypothetical protein HQL21_02320 [Candidatus Omnitrophica bacterium]|nr:hypothetical protein [Candidatus Omnitrophota bacterium]
MAYRFVIVVLVLCFSSSGCIFLLADALQKSSPKKSVTKSNVNKQSLKQEGPVEVKAIEGERQDVFNTTVTILLDRGYFITTSDYDSGLVVAERQEPAYSEIKASVAEGVGARTKVRVIASDSMGPVKDSKFLAKFFDDIQAEVVRRKFRKQKSKK